LLLVGIAGALCDEGKGREGLELGDVVIAESVSYVEFLKVTPKGVFYRHYPMDQPSVPLGNSISHQIKRSFDIAAMIGVQPPTPGVQPKIRLGEIVSGEKILSGDENDKFQSTLLGPFDKALAVDMESVGMARTVCERRTSHWYNPRFAVIRGISDLVGVANNTGVRDAWKVYAAHSAATVAAEFVNRFGVLLP
jgi:nucleoside phosphorylase